MSRSGCKTSVRSCTDPSNIYIYIYIHIYILQRLSHRFSKSDPKGG